MIVTNLNKVRERLKKQGQKYGGKPVVIVGFTQNYAVHVHENMGSQHPIGQAKYLEQPARELQGELGKVVSATVAGGGTLEQGLVNAGLRLQREAQKLTPIDTGALRASAFTAKESEADAKAAEAYKRGEAKRTASLKKGKK